MDPSTATVNCPDCARPIPLDAFADWGAQTMFKSAACPGCGLEHRLRTPVGEGDVQVRGVPRVRT